MTMRVVQEEKEIYRGYAELLCELSRVNFTIQGIPEANRGQIERGLQEMLTGEITRLSFEKLRANGVRGEWLDNRPLRTSLDGLPLPAADCRVLEEKVRQMAARMHPPDGVGDGFDDDDGGERRQPQQRHTQPAGSVTYQKLSHSGERYCMCAVSAAPGAEMPLGDHFPLPLPAPGKKAVMMALYLFVYTIFGMRHTGDALRVIVEDGAAHGLANDEMLVGLSTKVNWPKEIVAWSFCQGKVASVYQGIKDSHAAYMLLKKGCHGADTIVFSKPQFLGGWTDVAHFETRLFWEVFRGKRVTFTWLTD
jgi:hypothetical protein